MLMLSLVPPWTKESKNKILVMTPLQQTSLLCNIVWQECRGCSYKELVSVIGVIKNRLKSDKFPNTIDKILLEPNQFANPTKDTIPVEFCVQIDKLFQQKPLHNHLYFVNLSKVKNPKILKKIKSYKLTKIGTQHFY